MDPNMYDDGALHAACRKGNLKLVEEELRKNADVNAFDSYGRTPLMSLFTALNVGWFTDVDDCHRIAMLLVSHGAKLGPYDMRAMLYAVKYANLDTVMLLVNEANGYLNYHPPHRDSCLHQAVVAREPGVLDYVVTTFEREIWTKDPYNHWGDTPLLKASRPAIQNHKAIRLLLASGADFRIKDRQGLTSFDLLVSSHNRNPELAWTYFDFGLDILDSKSISLQQAVISSESPWMVDIIAEIARKELMGVPIVGENEKVFSQYPNASTWLNLCREQLREMQKMHFYRNVSFWHVLAGDRALLTLYVDNLELVQAFFNTKCNGLFPIYCARTRKKFFELLPRHRLIDLATPVICETLKRPMMFEIFQHEVMTYMEYVDFFKQLSCCIAA